MTSPLVETLLYRGWRQKDGSSLLVRRPRDLRPPQNSASFGQLTAKESPCGNVLHLPEVPILRLSDPKFRVGLYVTTR